MSKLVSLNPSTLETIGSVSVSSEKEIKQKFAQARAALPEWKALGLEGRIKALRPVVAGFRKRQDEFAQLISKEMGMPVSQSIHDVSGAMEYFDWYLDNAPKYLSPEVTYKDKDMVHTVYYEPFGVAAAITPWNFPASNLVWMVGQALIVGNTVVFKDSEEVSLCGQLIEEVFATAKLPQGVFSEIYGDGRVGKSLIEEDIDLICFTGSTATGQKLYQMAAEKFIKVFLELGGSAPGIVCTDADVDAVLDTIYGNRFDNCGQICDGLKRLIVHKSKYAEVVEKLTQKLKTITIGDASDPKTDLGPLVSAKQLKSLKHQVSDALDKGAKAVVPQTPSKKLKGYFYPPTLILHPKKEMKVWQEEVFGPVLPIVSFEKEEQAIKMANDTKYGLGGYVFTQNKETFNRIAAQIQTGMVQMNNAGYVVPASPFGGCKLSGMGREHGKFGFQDLSQVKVVAEEK